MMPKMLSSGAEATLAQSESARGACAALVNAAAAPQSRGTKGQLGVLPLFS